MADNTDYEKWEQDCAIIRAENKDLLALFERWLIAKSLAKKTIAKHRSYVRLYIDHYLLYYDAQRATETTDIRGYLFWYDNKVGFRKSKDALASCKKFYLFLYENEFISEEMYKAVKAVNADY